uniref:Uncharacterized protein n=1 Tax=Mustela putorius furo TaxID=9669 RepID=M3YRH4_MUSPF
MTGHLERVGRSPVSGKEPPAGPMAAPPAFKPLASLQLQEVRSLCKKKEVKALCDEKRRHGDPVAPPACGRAHPTQPVGPPSPVHYHYTLLPNLPSVAPPQAGLTPPRPLFFREFYPAPPTQIHLQHLLPTLGPASRLPTCVLGPGSPESH